jgi:1,4-alpha-glucan branching enzyme
MHKRSKNHSGNGNGTPLATAKEIEVVFALEHTEANEVYLCGDFNDWSNTNLPMIPRGDGLWLKSVTLPPGRYEYRFIVDGKWTSDPNGSQKVVNPFGSINSVAFIHGSAEVQEYPTS